MTGMIKRLAAGLAAMALLPMCAKDQSVSSPGYGAVNPLHFDRFAHRKRPRSPGHGVVINPIPGLASDFMMGADVSMLAQIEASGGKFYDESGQEKDCLQILQDHGINWVRLRLWNNPALAAPIMTKDGLMAAGLSAGGINDAARDTALAKRAKALGMKVLLDFHYSDWWADPGQQIIPVAWESMTLEQMEGAIYTFTNQVVGDMKAVGAAPDMVQIGNELNDGMLWPVGRISGPNGFDGFAALLTQASKAVRDVDPGIPVMIHLANGGDNSLYRWMFSNLIQRGVDFDIIGLSYYPYWHGPVSDLQFNMADVSEYFNKPVAVVETAYPFTLQDADSEKNSFSTSLETVGGYRATVQGQASFLRDLMDLVSNVPDGRGLGIFYWEPDWIPVAGAGWYTNGGDGWDNQAMFDSTGKALPSLNVFRAVSEHRPTIEPTIVSVLDQSIVVAASTAAPTLPSSVNVVYSDDSIRPLYVVWDAVQSSVWASPGAFDISGKVVGSSVPATLHVTVYINLLQDPGFESGNLTSWNLTADPGMSASATSGTSNAHSGTWSFNYWYSSTFNFTIQQTVTGLQAGTSYSFSVWAMGNAGGQLEAFATCGGTTTTASITNTGWPNWTQYTISDLDGSSGSCTVGVRANNASAGDWGNLDDFVFTY
jgi:arabinogalactan endo-1,4-beta-galactosidase